MAYWKQRMANFNNLLEQIKSQRLKSVIGTLQAAKSKSIDKWKEIVSLKKIIIYSICLTCLILI